MPKRALTNRKTDKHFKIVCLYFRHEKTQLHRNYNLQFEKQKRQFYLHV